ncbi:threonine-phosphate decarboxylase CobD [Celerinatantimonas sp. YJH-8]|uniref:threonine-phosphate decarboxylase CobD n=1 Tax=Celerinatantimonas sp. YJH-8 TaxID=3228714 RepID=UPI0038C32349
MLEHGGRLKQFACRYQRPVEQWVDLSTGVSPRSYPLAAPPQEVWWHLPESSTALLDAARQYYQQSSLLAVAGSQAAIMALPIILAEQFAAPLKVLLPRLGYQEHHQAWRTCGAVIRYFDEKPSDDDLDWCDVLLVIHPNNPAGWQYHPDELLNWQQQLQARGAWIIIDEAFIDVTPDLSVSAQAQQPGLIVLRSIGKFFGLAGARGGFVLANATLLSRLEQYLGPWSVSGPTQWAMTQALSDLSWQHQQRDDLITAGQRLADLLSRYFSGVVNCHLFCRVPLKAATDYFEQFCQDGILPRLTDERDALRFGLPQSETHWQRLQASCQRLVEIL